MGFISMIVVGIIAGVIARALMPGRDAMGWITTILLGIVGSFVGGFVINLVVHNEGAASDFQPTGIVGSIFGALIVLAIWHLVRRRQTA
jgi:uncharacterized membrane protein YeaQ/YmgE (transglycosylase-associated protein family)